MDTNSRYTGRIVVALGTALSLACAAFIVQAAPEVTGSAAPRVEVVRLEPVAVTIGAEKFDAIHAETQRTSLLARMLARKAAA